MTQQQITDRIRRQLMEEKLTHLHSVGNALMNLQNEVKDALSFQVLQQKKIAMVDVKNPRCNEEANTAIASAQTDFNNMEKMINQMIAMIAEFRMRESTVNRVLDEFERIAMKNALPDLGEGKVLMFVTDGK